MAHPLDLSAYKLEIATVEFKYADSYLIWDNVGEVWAGLAPAFPGLVVKKAEPRNTTFHYRNDFELRVEMNRAVVTHHRPDDELKELTAISTGLLDRVVDKLAITDFTRVGLRLNYWRQYATGIEAGKALASSGMFNIASVTPLGPSVDFTDPVFSGRWESKTRGVMLHVRAMTQKVDLDIPLNLVPSVELKTPERTGILQDVDYYTIGVSNTDQVRPRLWIESARQACRKALRSLQGASNG